MTLNLASEDRLLLSRPPGVGAEGAYDPTAAGLGRDLRLEAGVASVALWRLRDQGLVMSAGRRYARTEKGSSALRYAVRLTTVGSRGVGVAAHPGALVAAGEGGVQLGFELLDHELIVTFTWDEIAELVGQVALAMGQETEREGG